jgi:hypothetical protein
MGRPQCLADGVGKQQRGFAELPDDAALARQGMKPAGNPASDPLRL